MPESPASTGDLVDRDTLTLYLVTVDDELYLALGRDDANRLALTAISREVVSVSCTPLVWDSEDEWRAIYTALPAFDLEESLIAQGISAGFDIEIDRCDWSVTLHDLRDLAIS